MSAAITTTAEQRQCERLPVAVYREARDAAEVVAREIRDLVLAGEREGRPVVLGLATGSTPVWVYRRLIAFHQEGLSFRHVVTFNLDEYFGLPPDHPESYAAFMHRQLFAHLDIDPANTHVPDGRLPREQVFDYCRDYEERIRRAGGIDLQLLGIGRTGHIGFNEPGSPRDSRTRLVTLDRLTRQDAVRDFRGEANVPRHALTMGIGTILDARRVRLLAWGEAKAAVVARSVEGDPDPATPASLLQGHPDLSYHVDLGAASELVRFREPWRVGSIEWTITRQRQAVHWLSIRTGKAILKLVDGDYGDHGLAELLVQHGPAYNLNIQLFNEFQHTITGWPGGKPGVEDRFRPERNLPFPKCVVVFAPEPMDAFLGMGGTLNRLLSQGHEVWLAVMTSGNLAVPDGQARGVVQIAQELSREGSRGDPASWVQDVVAELEAKEPSAADSPALRRIKGLIRREETRAAAAEVGLPANRVVHLDLPFYDAGGYRRFHPTEADRERLEAFLRDRRPDQVFATGSADDPASVGGVCWALAREALTRLRAAGGLPDFRLWLYRGGGREWEIHRLGMAVPLSPDERTTKSRGIYRHTSQASQLPVHETQHREAWQQAESVNAALAHAYDELGLPEYEALEGFVRHDLP